MRRIVYHVCVHSSYVRETPFLPIASQSWLIPADLDTDQQKKTKLGILMAKQSSCVNPKPVQHTPRPTRMFLTGNKSSWSNHSTSGCAVLTMAAGLTQVGLASMACAIFTGHNVTTMEHDKPPVTHFQPNATVYRRPRRIAPAWHSRYYSHA